MLKDFFKLNTPFETLKDVESFKEQLKVSKHICNILYEPTSISKLRPTGIIFENISFSKTNISDVTFAKCTFKDCLFIGTIFDEVEFHDCIFFNCNFFKSKFSDVYAKPSQFEKAISDIQYANIAIGLYQELRENYSHESQREYKNEAEYYFHFWKQENDYIQSKRKGQLAIYSFLKYSVSWIYGFTLGYGYRFRRLFFTTICMMTVVAATNHFLADLFYKSPPEKTFINTLYFTITTMATLGSSGSVPDTQAGHLFIVINIFCGIFFFSATISSILKKVVR